jgi:hypothetical protein
VRWSRFLVWKDIRPALQIEHLLNEEEQRNLELVVSERDALE